MSRRKQIVELGELGEEILLIHLSAISKNIQISSDPYDSSRDITFQDKTIEVKTQTRHTVRNIFSTERRPINLKKCMSVDMLVFVEFDHTDFISIWTPRDREHYTDYTLDSGTRMRGWYINNNEIGPGCKCITTLRCPQISARMRALSPSTLFINDKEKSNYSKRPTL